MIQKGRCQNSAIVGTFAMAHVVEYDELPDAGSFANDEKPIGALILAHQAVLTVFVLQVHRRTDFKSG
jgi:hypothetical protein